MARLSRVPASAIVALCLSCAWPWAARAAVLPDNAPAEITGMRASVDHALHWIATVIEVAGVGIIVVGALLASVLFLRQGFRDRGWARAYRGFRANLGRGILLGLELLVAADIIGTVAVTPSFRSLGVLALIVLIRTFLSFSLEVEIEGHWPWRRREMQKSDPAGERL
jgi:uncharacterized membrane protein